MIPLGFLFFTTRKSMLKSDDFYVFFYVPQPCGDGSAFTSTPSFLPPSFLLPPSLYLINKHPLPPGKPAECTHPSREAAVLCPPILQRRLLCGALFSNTWCAHPPKTLGVYFSWGVQKMKNGTPMLRGDHFFLCFPCSVALRILTFSTPLRRECLFWAWAILCYARQYFSFACAAVLCFPTLALRCLRASEANC